MTRNYRRKIFVCDDCGHSIDLHKEDGCRVVSLFTKEKCPCSGFLKDGKRGLPNKDEEEED